MRGPLLAIWGLSFICSITALMFLTFAHEPAAEKRRAARVTLLFAFPIWSVSMALTLIAG